MISKYGNQCSKGLPTTSTAPSHRNGRQGCIHSLQGLLTRMYEDPLPVNKSSVGMDRQTDRRTDRNYQMIPVTFCLHFAARVSKLLHCQGLIQDFFIEGGNPVYGLETNGVDLALIVRSKVTKFHN